MQYVPTSHGISTTYNAQVNDDVNKRTVKLWIVAVAAGGSSLVQPADSVGYSLIIKCDYTAFTSLVLTPTNTDYVLL